MPNSDAEGWREKQKRRLRELLYSTALDLFKREGFDKTTMQQIADAAGVAKGTFFNYFSSKDEILVEWYHRVTLGALRIAQARAFKGAEDAFIGLAEALTAGVMAEPRLWAMKGGRSVADGPVLESERALDGMLQNYCVRTLQGGKATGELSSDLDETFFASAFIALLTGTGQSWNANNNDFDLTEVMRARTAFLFRAARPTGDR